jgi:hypothetical protein
MKTKKMPFNFLNNSKKIKHSIKTLAIFLLLAGTVISCSKKEDDADSQAQEELPDGDALAQRFIQNREDALQLFTIVAENGGTIQGEKGTVLTIPAGALALNGNPVSGNVQISLIEIYSKEDMVRLNMPTNGKRPNGDIEMIKSAGEFFIEATQNGNKLDLLAPMQLASKPLDFSEVDPQMTLFEAGEDLEDTDPWVQNEFTQVGIGEVPGPNGGYEAVYLVDLSDFGWTNLDRWYNYTGELTTLNIDVPEGYNGTNCEVYLSYDGEASGLARMDVYDAQTEMFTEHFGKIPVGQQVHIILIAEINGVLHYTIQGTTITQNHVEVMAQPQPGTEADLINSIANLP